MKKSNIYGYFTGLACIVMAALFLCPTSATAANIVSTKKTYTYARMVSDIQKLTARYPQLITSEIIGTSAYGRNLYALRLTIPDSWVTTSSATATPAIDTTLTAEAENYVPAATDPKPVVLINGAHHGREWISSTLCMTMLEQYAKAVTANSTIDGTRVRTVLSGCDLVFVPMVNPDGVTISQSGLKHFSKSARKRLKKYNRGSSKFTRWKANGQGIDLNRQYDAGWKIVKVWSSTRPSYANYKGKRPLQAPEAAAMATYTKRLQPKATLAYHSVGKLIYWGYELKGSAKTRALKQARALRKITGYKIMPTAKKQGAGYTDWVSNKLKLPAFTLEIGSGRGGKRSDLSEFSAIWKQNRSVPFYLISL
ncbi:MAG: hypothetical protein LBS17_06855 [Actinomycetes bacterium]|jgi:murein tripeptide amidase MpaA|nr:hypothetical protein [Actinomycetes bacterium]